MTLREQLLEMADPGYRDFHAALVPGIGNIIGIRLPLLRGIARMGVAWAVSLCFIRFPERTMRWLRQACPLDDWTYNKSLQKIVESYRVTDADKAAVRAMKRRKNNGANDGVFAK